MKASRTALALLIFVAAFGVWVSRQGVIYRLALDITHSQARQSALQERIAASRNELEELGGQINEENAQAKRLKAEIKKSAEALAQVNPDAAWAEPPPLLPDWNPDSPYVWIRKETLKQIPFPALSNDGRLNSKTAVVLAVDQKELASLNDELERVIGEYRKVELANVQLTEPGRSDSAAAAEPKLTVYVPPLPEQGNAAKEQYIATLRRFLGGQRTELLEELGSRWFDSEFSASGTEGKTISAQRRSDGAYSISVQSGKRNRMSVSGPTDLGSFVPRHLLPFFRPLLDQARLAEPSQTGNE